MLSRILSRRLKFSRVMVASDPLGIEVGPVGVRTRVERRLISSTVPTLSPKRQKSPTRMTSSPRIGNAAEEVFQRFLRRKCDGETADTDSSEEGGQVEAQGAEDGENCQQENGSLEHPLAQNHERTVPIRPDSTAR